LPLLGAGPCSCGGDAGPELTSSCGNDTGLGSRGREKDRELEEGARGASSGGGTHGSGRWRGLGATSEPQRARKQLDGHGEQRVCRGADCGPHFRQPFTSYEMIIDPVFIWLIGHHTTRGGHKIPRTEPNLPRTEPKFTEPKYSVPCSVLSLQEPKYRGKYRNRTELTESTEVTRNLIGLSVIILLIALL
jgi:hypothetical protein